ncbi:MAG: hypothetical protein ABMB14_09340 [Myxococcota bacterium]
MSSLVWIASAWAGPDDDGGGLPLAPPAVPEQRLYGKIELEDGQATGKLRRRRDGEFVAWELPNGTIVRYQKLAGARVAEDHLLDADGFPLVTVTFGPTGAPDKAVVGAIPPVEVPLPGWLPRQVPGGTLALPTQPDERPGGGARVDALGGEVDVWLEQGMDPFSDPFRDGLVAGCGCFVVDRATAWIDGRAGIRYRLLIPGHWPRDAVDLWAVPVPTGTWLMSYRVSSPADPVDALVGGRILAALAKLDD